MRSPEIPRSRGMQRLHDVAAQADRFRAEADRLELELFGSRDE